MSDEIQSLDILEHIRARPEMYMGTDPARSHPNTLLKEAMCMALAEAQCGSCSQIEVKCGALGASIIDNGIGWSSERTNTGLSFPELILTHLHACLDHKTHQELAHKLCGSGIVVVTALSSWLKLETVNESGLWEMSIRDGRLKLPLTRRGPASHVGTRLSFELDARYFPRAC